MQDSLEARGFFSCSSSIKRLAASGLVSLMSSCSSLASRPPSSFVFQAVSLFSSRDSRMKINICETWFYYISFGLQNEMYQ